MVYLYINSANKIEAIVVLAGIVGGLIHVIEDPVEDLYQDVQASLIAPDRVTMMMVTIEDGKTKANQWSLGIALQKLPVGASNQIVDRFGEEQRAHVPEILARIDFTAFAEGRRG